MSSVGSSKTFSYTGGVQSFNACAGRTYKLEVWGAQGGLGAGGNANNRHDGGKGGYAYGAKSFLSDTVLYVVVGGQGLPQRYYDGYGTTSAGGYNGGGQAFHNQSSDKVDYFSVGSGGGATHIATRTGVLSGLSSYKSDVLIVAGGGGGGCDGWTMGTAAAGAGGGTSGGNGNQYSNYTIPTGGNQSSGGAWGGQGSAPGSYANGSFGQGGYGNTGNSINISGGGGGWYGGGSGTWVNAGGGSGYIGGVTSGSMTSGQRSGNGQAKITWQS